MKRFVSIIAALLLCVSSATPQIIQKGVQPALLSTKCGSTKLTVGANTTSVVNLSVKNADMIFIVADITGYGGSDVASFRFNGDSGANYWSRFESWAAGGAVPADNPQAADTLIRTGIVTTLGRTIFMFCNNQLSKEKICAGDSTIGTGTTAVPAIISGLSGAWVNTTAQINSVTMVTPAANNMGAGSGFEVFCLKF